jgi:BirA family biotin operon repressor/biotin-[acetyl-CoA-carboxylase] ligase
MVQDTLAQAVHHLPAGWRGEFYAEVGSTQEVARAAVHSGAPSRSIFVADHQSAGRGRQGRSWLDRPGQALMLSILLRQSAEPRPWRSTALASVALVEALEAVLPELDDVAIKWPNDVLVGGRKLAGVLAESMWDGVQSTLIVGVGVNVHSTEDDLAAVAARATSVLLATGQRIDRGKLLLQLVHRLDAWLARPEAELQATWQSRLWGRGQRVRLMDLDRDEEVVVLGASFDGALRVRLADGREVLTNTGELIP